MKHLKHLLIASTVTALCACNNTKESPVSLQWEMVKNGAAPGFYESTFTITNTSTKPLESDWEIYYTQLSPRQVKVNEDSPVIIEMINAGYYKIAPSESWTPLAPGDSIKISYLNQGIFTQTLFTPKSPFFVTNNGTQISIPLSIAPFDRKEQWTVQGRIAPSYPDGEKVYADNQALETTYKIQTYDMLPSLKEVTPREGTSIISKDISLSVEDGFADEAKLLIQNLKEMGYNVTDKGQTVIALCHFPQNMQAKNDEHYRLDVKDNYITISGGTPHAIFNGTQTLVSLLKKQTIPAKLENIAINDYPDLLYRGMMLDIARNFTKKADLLKLINQLAAYKINVLHFHFSDDEAWRLEIPGLEELTAIGSRRGFTEDESQCLYPVYYGGWNPNDTTATANGYYTREDFIEVLQYAAKRHITVIPEIESPGHARAAIKAMEARFNRLKGEDMEKAREYLLSESADTSKYVSAQAYTDNIMNVALPSVYRFMDKVSDEIIKMYKDAGVPLATIHIGGDEVKYDQWKKSAQVRNFMKEQNIKTPADLQIWFTNTISHYLESKKKHMMGWNEITGVKIHDYTDFEDAASGASLAEGTIVHFWRGDPSLIKQTVKKGYQVVNSYHEYTYLDYDTAYTSLEKAYHFDPLAGITGKKTDLIIGIGAQMWGEWIPTPSDMYRKLYPRIAALAECGWTSPSNKSWKRFNQAAYKENLRWKQLYQ